VRRYPGLHHMAAGAVSVSRGGDEVAVTLGRALALDPSHQARAAPGSRRRPVRPRRVSQRADGSYRSSLNSGSSWRQVRACVQPRPRPRPSSGRRGPTRPGARAQVVGRVHDCEAVLAKVAAAETDRDDAPLERVVVSACGLTDNQARPCARRAAGPAARSTGCTSRQPRCAALAALTSMTRSGFYHPQCFPFGRHRGRMRAQGTHETLEEAAARAARRRETPAQAAVRLEADSATAREAVRCAPQAPRTYGF
jgi:hypothetical protein